MRVASTPRLCQRERCKNGWTTSAQPSLPCVVHGIGWSRSHRLAARELKREAAQAHRICREQVSQGHKRLLLLTLTLAAGLWVSSVSDCPAQLMRQALPKL